MALSLEVRGDDTISGFVVLLAVTMVVEQARCRVSEADIYVPIHSRGP